MIKSIRIHTKSILFLTTFFILGGVSIGQPDIDPVQAEKELEVMKSVISTSLSLTRKSLREVETSESRRGRLERYALDFDEESIEGYYLYGQGVVFTIPYPCLSGRFPGDWEDDIDVRLEEVMEGALADRELVEQEVEILLNEVEMQRQELGLSHSVPPPPAPPAAPNPPAAPEPDPKPGPVASKEDIAEAEKNLEKKVSRIKVRLREVKEQTEEQKAKTAKEREAIKQELIGIVAVHGGSMTQVKENEFINLILRDQCRPFVWNDSKDERTVLSVKKADISAYRSGQITMEQLKSRFIEY